MRGSVYKRCPCGTSGTPGKPACKKSHGAWWWRADGSRDPQTGRRRQPAQGGYQSKGEAAEALSEYLAAQRVGTWVDDQRLTVAAWLARWLEESEARGLDAKTLVGYRSHVDGALVPHLGRHRLRDLRRQHVEDMFRALAAPGAGRRSSPRMPRTLDSYRRTLRAALSAAKRRGLVAQNVAEGRLETLPRVGRPERTAWEPEEVRAFLEHVADDDQAALYEVAAFAGLRRSELLGLRWSDLDLDGRAPGINVRQKCTELAGAHPCATCGASHRGRLLKAGAKSEAGVRWVPLVPETIAVLRSHRARQDADRRTWGDAYRDHDLVFALADGDPMRPGAVTRRFEELAAQVRIVEEGAEPRALPRIVLHELRHGACSLLVWAGSPMETVRLLLGHTSEDVFRQWYAHTLRGAASEGMRASVALVRGDGRAQSVHTSALSDDSSSGGEVT